MIEIELSEVKKPKRDNESVIYKLSDETMAKRQQNVINQMKKKNIDALVIYGDLELVQILRI